MLSLFQVFTHQSAQRSTDPRVGSRLRTAKLMKNFGISIFFNPFFYYPTFLLIFAIRHYASAELFADTSCLLSVTLFIHP